MKKADFGGRAPAVLLPYQQRWCADKSPVKVIEKSRRVGLSWGEAADATLLAASQSGMDVWYIGYNKDMAQEFIRDCADWAKFYRMAADEIEEAQEVFKDGDDEKSILTFVIRFASGFKITALSSRPSNLRGKQGRVIIDEAAFHDNLSELLKAAMALLIWGGQVHIISTHNGVDNALNELVSDIRAGKKSYSLHRVTFDDAVKDGLYERICLKTGEPYSKEAEEKWVSGIRADYGDDADEELDCVPKNSGGAWLSRDLIESRMSPDTPVIEYEVSNEFTLLAEHIRIADTQDWCEKWLKPALKQIPREAMTFFGEDFGRTGDLTVITPLYQKKNLQRSCTFALELRNVPFKQQEQILYYVVDRLPRFMGGAMDGRGNGHFLAEVAQQKYGSNRIHVIMPTESWYREHTPPFKAALEDGTLVDLPQNDNILADLRAFQVINGVARLPDTRNKDKHGKKRHGDSGIALILGYFASRELNKGEVTVKSRRRRKAAKMMEGY